MDLLNNWYKILAGFGFPSIFAIVVYVMRMAKNLRILMRAQQADMRHQLIDDYHTFMDRGWLSDDELEDWEARYQSYHSLGQNGVLDCKRQDLMKLPNKPVLPNI